MVFRVRFLYEVFTLWVSVLVDLSVARVVTRVGVFMWCCYCMVFARFSTNQLGTFFLINI